MSIRHKSATVDICAYVESGDDMPNIYRTVAAEVADSRTFITTQALRGPRVCCSKKHRSLQRPSRSSAALLATVFRSEASERHCTRCSQTASSACVVSMLLGSSLSGRQLSLVRARSAETRPGQSIACRTRLSRQHNKRSCAATPQLCAIFLLLFWAWQPCCR